MPTEPKPGNAAFVDMFDREDGDLGNDWTDAHDLAPSWWDRLRLVDGVPRIPRPDKGQIQSPTNSGARAAFFRDFGPGYDRDIAVAIGWNGIMPYECSPLLHVNPEDDDFGVGAWYVRAYKGLLFAAVGRRPDMVRPIELVRLDHRDGAHRRLEIRSTGKEFVTFVSDPTSEHRVMKKVGQAVTVPDGLVGSSTHGVALDLNQDQGRPPDQEVFLPPFSLQRLRGD